MPTIKKFKDATAFRTSFEERLKLYSTKNNVNLNQLRQSVAFDRFLARLFLKSPSPWVLKGGYAMQLRISNARSTKDVDLAMREAPFLSGSTAERDLALTSYLEEYASIDLGDYFSFIIGAPTLDIAAAPYGGSRLPIDVIVDRRLFVRFKPRYWNWGHLD